MAISGQAEQRRAANARGLAAFGGGTSVGTDGELYRVVHEGGKLNFFTIGYERRDGEGLIAALRDAGVRHLADVRDNPVSRKPDFRAGALKKLCEDAGIEYGAWTDLGSTDTQRENLQATGDFSAFRRNFRAYALRNMDEPLERLIKVAKKKTVALLCYERLHNECHRSIISEILAERYQATVTAIL